MFAVDCSHNRDDGSEKQECAIAFIGFDDHVFAAPQARGGAQMIHAASHNERGVKSGGGENTRGHRRGCCLAVSPGDGDAVFQSHQLGEHFRARNYGNFVAMRFGNLGIVAAHGGGSYHDMRAENLFGLVAFENFRAQILEPLGDRGTLHVRSCDAVAQRQQHFGDSAHADPADADQVYALKISKCDHHIFLFPSVPTAPICLLHELCPLVFWRAEL